MRASRRLVSCLFVVLAGACSKDEPSAGTSPTSAPVAVNTATATPSVPAVDPAKAMPSATATGGGPSETTPPKANAQMQAVLDELAALHGKPLGSVDAKEARKQPTPADAVKAVLKKQGKGDGPEPVRKTEDRKIAGAAGDIPARIYWPAGVGPFPVVLYIHGGGFVIADKDVYDASPRALTNLAHAVVVSIDYRQAPENKFPAAHDDAIAAYKWVLKNAATIMGDPKKIALVGESAGGNLAANVAIAARDQKLQMPLAEVLVYPIASSDMDSPSYKENENAKPLGKVGMKWFGDQYFRTAADGKDPRIDLVHAKLDKLPPTTIITAQIDPLRSDGEMLAAKLKDAGVTVAIKNYDGVTHEFFGMGAVIDAAKDAETFAADALKKAFGQ